MLLTRHIHYMGKSLWASDQSHPFMLAKNSIQDLVQYAVIITFTLLGRLYTKLCCVAVRICASSATWAVVTSGINVGQGSLKCIQCFSSSKRYSVGLRSMLCAGHYTVLLPCSLGKPSLHNACFVNRSIALLEQ